MYSVDTNVLIWGLKKQATPNRMHMIPRAVAFLEQTRLARIRLIVPSQVMAELLSGYSDEIERHTASKMLETGFYIAPLDANAANIAASLWGPRAKECIKEFETTRQCIKADINILASSIAAGANTLYSSEYEKFTKLAAGKILVKDLPELDPRAGSVQQSLLGERFLGTDGFE